MWCERLLKLVKGLVGMLEAAQEALGLRGFRCRL
jgi:hypothetical protein